MNTPLPATMIRSRYTPLLYLCSFVLIGMAGIALFAPWIAPHDPNLVDLTQKLHGPSSAYPLGTDQLGRCLFRVDLRRADFTRLCRVDFHRLARNRTVRRNTCRLPWRLGRPTLDATV